MRDPAEKVVVGYLRPPLVHGSFVECLMDLLIFDMAHHRRIVDGGGRLSYLAGHNLSAPRNEVVRKFLAYGKAEWLWMVDSDMTFTPDTLERLLEHADPDTAPIVGGLCFSFDEHGLEVPTLYDLGNLDGKREVVRYDEWPPDAMFQVAATGAACLLIHRSVFDRIRTFEHPDRPGATGFNATFPWFQETELDGRPVSEDITFCWRAGIAGMPLYVNTAVQIGHVKERVLSAGSYLAQQATLGRRSDLYRVVEEAQA